MCTWNRDNCIGLGFHGLDISLYAPFKSSPYSPGPISVGMELGRWIVKWSKKLFLSRADHDKSLDHSLPFGAEVIVLVYTVNHKVLRSVEPRHGSTV